MQININKRQVFIILFLSSIIFIPRLLNLDVFLNPDGALFWFSRSLKFYAGLAHTKGYDLRDTYQAGHPGVTVMLVSGASILLGSFIEHGDLNAFAHKHELFYYAKLPIALITGLCIIFVYSLLSRQYKMNYFPLIAAIFIAVDPYFLVHSRHFQLDSLTAMFMLLALLTSVIYCQNGKTRIIILSGFFTGLALLTKSYAFSLIPFIIAGIAFQKYWSKERSQEFKPFKGFITWILITGLTFVILWPSMWVQPVFSIKQIFGGATFSITHSHENTGSLKNNKLGTVANPTKQGLKFKTDLFDDFVNKNPSIYLIFGVISFLLIINKFFRRKIDKETELVAYISGFFFFYLIGMSFSGKAGTRYCIIAFLLFDIIAAYGFVSILSWFRNANINQNWKPLVPGLLIALLCFHMIRLFNYHPYYQAFQNEIYRKNPKNFSWGLGLELVAEHLKNIPGNEKLTVASFYPQVLSQFYRGKVIHLRTIETDTPDYIVLYLSQVDRYLYPELVRKYYLNPNQKPEFVARIYDYEYAWVYRNQDKISNNDSLPQLDKTLSINNH